MKKLTADKVKSILIKAAEKANSTDSRSYRHRRLKEVTYRNVAGKFTVRDCEFSNYSNKYSFSPITLEASSYGWWGMLKVINGKLVHNACGYSSQTSKHQSQLREQLKILGIKPDLVISTKANIKNMTTVQAAYLKDWAELQVKLENCQKKSLQGYKKRIRALERLMGRMETLKVGVRFTKKAKAVYLQNARTERLQSLSWKRSQNHYRQKLDIAVGESPRLDLSAGSEFPRLVLVSN